MGRNGFIIRLSKGKLLEFSAAKLNLLGKLSLFTYYKWHPSETLYINVRVEGFSQKEQSDLTYLHSKRQADIYDGCPSAPNCKPGPGTQGQAVPGLLTCAKSRGH